MAKISELQSPSVRTLISAQAGVLSAAQAKSGGLPHETVRQRVTRGIWQRILPGVYLLQCGPPSLVQRAVAAQLYCGYRSMVTGPAALRLQGFGGAPWTWDGTANLDSEADERQPHPADGLMHVLVPHDQRRQNAAFVRVTRTTRLPEQPVPYGGLRLAPPTRAIVDAFGWCLNAENEARTEGMVRQALSQGRVGVDELEGELARGPRRSSARLRSLLATAKAEERTTAARRFLEGLGREGPFGALRNVAIYAGRTKIAVAEALWPTRAVVAAVGASEEQGRSLARLGFAVVPITPRKVAEDLAGVLHSLAAVLVARPEATLPRGVALLPLGPGRAPELGMG